MQTQTRKGSARVDTREVQANNILLLGATMGFFAERLMWDAGPTGLGFVLWVMLLGLAACRITWLQQPHYINEVIAWSVVAMLAAVVMLVRTAAPIIILMILVLIVCAAMVLLRVSGTSSRDSTVLDCLSSILLVPLSAGLAASRILREVDLRPGSLDPRLWASLRGILLAIPVLVLFGLLFASADAVFSAYADGIIALASEEALGHLAMLLGFAWVSTGLLAGVACRQVLNRARARTRRDRHFLEIGDIEVGVMLGLVLALFASFVVLQLGYLFGGRETIELRSGLTVADYARRGFFESLVISGLTLALLIFVAGIKCSRRVFQPLAGLLILCVLIILLSAGQRLDIYVEEFGLTLARLTAAAIMLWLGLCFSLFILTLFRGRSRDFAAGLIVSGVAMALLFSLVNPSQVVVRTNLQRYLIGAQGSGPDIDSVYLLSLGADAVPILTRRLAEFPESQQCVLARGLLFERPASSESDTAMRLNWRDWNASRHRASIAVEESRATLMAVRASCGPGVAAQAGFRSLSDAPL